MGRKVFFSFHYKPENWRASQVRNMGVVEGNQPCSDNDWEDVVKGGDTSIQRWIDGQLSGRSCAVVLIGAGTAGRKWINYEIKKAWDDGKGVLGVHIHNLKDNDGSQARKGTNPFDGFTVNGAKLSAIVKAYDPPCATSKAVYDHIKQNLSSWIETAIEIRGRY